MLILIGLLFVCVICAVIASRSYGTRGDAAGAIYIVAGVVLFSSVCVVSINHISAIGKVEEYGAFVESLNSARVDSDVEIERAAILSKIAEWNGIIKSARAYNDTVFDIFVPDKIAELELIDTGLIR